MLSYRLGTVSLMQLKLRLFALIVIIISESKSNIYKAIVQRAHGAHTTPHGAIEDLTALPQRPCITRRGDAKPRRLFCTC